MKKFGLDVKSTLGLAPKTVDPDYDHRAAGLKTVDHAIRDYHEAIGKLKTAMQGVVASMDTVSKAFVSMSSQADAPTSVKKISDEFAEMQKRVRDTHYPAYKQALDDHGDGALTELKTAADECKKLENERNKVMPDYDTYRDSVSKKEAEYAKKGKDISESKNYAAEVEKRDKLKAEFEDADSKFKAKCDEIVKSSHTAYLAAMRALISETSDFLSNFEGEMKDAHTHSKSV